MASQGIVTATESARRDPEFQTTVTQQRSQRSNQPWPAPGRRAGEMDPESDTSGYARVLLSGKLAAEGSGRTGGRWSCGDLWAEENVVSQVVEAPDQIGRGARPCLLIKERLSEFLEGNGLGEHVKHGDQDLVRDGGPLRASARLQPVVLVLVVAALGPGGAGLNGLEVDVTLAGHRVLLLSGALVIAGTNASPGGQAPGVAEHGEFSKTGGGHRGFGAARCRMRSGR